MNSNNVSRNLFHTEEELKMIRKFGAPIPPPLSFTRPSISGKKRPNCAK